MRALGLGFYSAGRCLHAPLAVRDGERLLDLVLQRRGLLPEVGLRGQHVTAAAAVRCVLCHAPIEEEAAAPEQPGRRCIARHAARLPML